MFLDWWCSVLCEQSPIIYFGTIAGLSANLAVSIICISTTRSQHLVITAKILQISHQQSTHISDIDGLYGEYLTISGQWSKQKKQRQRKKNVLCEQCGQISIYSVQMICKFMIIFFCHALEMEHKEEAASVYGMHITPHSLLFSDDRAGWWSFWILPGIPHTYGN